MSFKTWLEDSKSLAVSYKDTLKDVPQSTDHHKEGNVLNHVKLVRKSIQNAIQELKNLKQNHPEASYILSDIDFDLNIEEQRIINLAVWLHDIGKATATRMNGFDFNKKHLNWDKEEYQGKPLSSFEIMAPNHQRPEHYMPQIEKLKKEAPPQIIKFYEDNKDLFDFLIDNHMQFTNGPTNNFIKNNFENGRLKKEKKLKLLMILMWADKLGRIGGTTKSNIDKLIKSSKKNLDFEKRAIPKKPFEGSPQELKELLRSRGIPEDQIKKAVLAKFGFYESLQINEEKSSKTKSGKKVPGKYLSGLSDEGKYGSKEAMKKEIDQFRGKDQYKLNWDADYKNGKRIKTKKGKATKAFEKRFGKNKESK